MEGKRFSKVDCIMKTQKITTNKQTKASEPKLTRTLIKDIREGHIAGNVRSELYDVQQYYLTPERQERLKSMGWFRRWFCRLVWITKALIFKLSPLRRILLVLSLICSISIQSKVGDGSSGFTLNSNFFGYFLLMLVVALELKDKLIARDELELGRKVQHSLLPVENPKIANWDIWLYTTSANEVGGDLVDYIKFMDGWLGVTIGDVSGKGLGAALLMAKLQASIKALTRIEVNSTEMIKHLNRIFCEDVPASNFASLIYIKLSSDDKRVNLINAGHMPPLFYKQKKLHELEHNNPALGMIKDVQFDEQSIEMEANDVLFLYSDGLSEARNADHELFGEERISKLIMQCAELDVKKMAEKILDTVKRFVGNERMTDDLSFIIIKRVAS